MFFNIDPRLSLSERGALG